MRLFHHHLRWKENNVEWPPPHGDSIKLAAPSLLPSHGRLGCKTGTVSHAS